MIRVNGELIDPNLIEETFARIKSEAERQTQASCCERDAEFTKAAEEEVIDFVLIAQEAGKTSPNWEEGQVESRLQELKVHYREEGATSEALQGAEGQLREEVEANLRMESFIMQKLPPVTEPNEEELGKYYQSRSSHYRTLPEVQALHLVKMIDEHEDYKGLLEEMAALRQSILAGEDFAKVAREETEKSSGDIDLGWVPLDRPTNPFETILFSLTVGEVSPVVSYEHALHLVQVVAKRGGEVPPLAEIADELKNQLMIENRQAALRDFAKGLRESATIEQVDF